MSINADIRLMLCSIIFLVSINLQQCHIDENSPSDYELSLKENSVGKTDNIMFVESIEKILRENLFNNYSLNVRPVLDVDRSTIVNITVTILQIMGLVRQSLARQFYDYNIKPIQICVIISSI